MKHLRLELTTSSRCPAPARADTASPTPPFEGLLAGLRVAIGAGDRRADAEALHGIADWNAVAGLARRHRVGSLLLCGARAVSAPPAADAALAPLRRRTVMRGLRQLAGLRRATDRLTESGIPWLVLKGLPLSMRLFATPLARECIDIDLLVPPDAAHAAGEALSSGGWRLVKPSFEPTPARNRCYDRFVKDRVFVGFGSALELHRRLLNNPFLLPAPFESLHANAAAIEVGGRRVAALADDDLLVYLAVHGQMHRWSRLKWLCDVAALLASIGGERFESAIEKCRRRKLGLEPVFGAALRLCRESFHVRLPPAAACVPSGAGAGRAALVSRRIWARPRAGAGLRGAARRVDELRLGLAMNPSWRSAAHELARLCAAPYDLGRVNLPDRLFFLYLPLRPALWLAGLFARNSRRTGRPAREGR